MSALTFFGGNDRYQIDMCRGPLLRQIILFIVPLIVSGLLQFMFNAADLVVIGRFASGRSLAAVGATISISMLLINIFIGLSVGANVMVARYIGEKNVRDISRTVHTAICVSLCGGALLAAIGIASAKFLLILLNTPEDILAMSVRYMWICFAGMPVIMLYNFGSAILRAMGDTTRPFYFLLISGIINVLLNLFFVTVLHWDVAGVAAATVISQGIAAYLVIQVLRKLRGPCRFKWQVMSIRWKNFREIMFIGVPAGFNGAFFCLANMLIQSAINRFGSAAIAGSTAAGTWENIGYITLSAVGQAMTSFISQNYGGGRIDRIRSSFRWGIVLACLLGGATSAGLLLGGRNALALFNADPEVIRCGMERFIVILPLFFFCGIMEVYNGALRGLGYSMLPTLLTLFFVCVMRVIWIYTVFARWQTIGVLFLSWPVTWVLDVIAMAVMWTIVMRKFSAVPLETA